MPLGKDGGWRDRVIVKGKDRTKEGGTGRCNNTKVERGVEGEEKGRTAI